MIIERKFKNSKEWYTCPLAVVAFDIKKFFDVTDDEIKAALEKGEYLNTKKATYRKKGGTKMTSLNFNRDDIPEKKKEKSEYFHGYNSHEAKKIKHGIERFLKSNSIASLIFCPRCNRKTPHSQLGIRWYCWAGIKEVLEEK